MTYGLWLSWSVVTLLFNFTNSINSRSKNSRSLKYNAVSTALASAFYVCSMLGVGNLLIEARHGALVFAVLAYSALSVAGSVLGQKWSLRFEREHHIRK